VTISLFGQFESLSRKAFGANGRKRRRREMMELLHSGLFDPRWYLESYTDVRESGVDPARHYLESGWREGRDPGPQFCTTAYLRANADVAAQDINPLLHYIQHGQSEGRGAPDLVAPVRALVDVLGQFGPAAPCAHFPLPQQEVARWTRAARIPNGRRSIEIDDFVVAIGADDSSCKKAREAISLLGWLASESGSDSAGAGLSEGACTSLIDAWDAGAGRFCTRWATAEQAIVIRAIQQIGDEPELIGEGCVTQELDIIDARPKNPFFPILFLFSNVDGCFIGYRLLTFPSLCRGGLHYPELVAIAHDKDGNRRFDIAESDERLGRKLISLRSGEETPLIQIVEIESEGADGTDPIFQADFRDWLAKVACVSVASTDDAEKLFTSDRVIRVARLRTGGRAALKIAHDMVPTVSVLCAGPSPGEAAHELPGSFIVASDDPSAPATVARPPAGIEVVDTPGYSSVFPTIVPLATDVPLPTDPGLVAIRKAAPAPSEAELLVPRSCLNEAPDLPPISGLIWPDDWDQGHLVQALESLALQIAVPETMIFVGEPQPNVRRAAAQFFDDRVTVARDDAEAADQLGSGIVIHVGPGIVLHDTRTLSVLGSLLLSQGAQSVSAPVVFAETRGKGSVVAQADASGISMALFRGAAIPVAKPTGEFWMACAVSARDWLSRPTPRLGNGLHIYSTLVSVSTLDRRHLREPRINLPESRFGVSTELVFG
jgi:hypothetical protein